MLTVTNVRTAATLELGIEYDSLVPQDSGSREAAAVQFDLTDPDLTFDLAPEDEIVISTVEDPAIPQFGGFARVLATDIEGLGRKYHVTAYDYSTLLDRINVVQDDRAAGESDHDRLVYLVTTYASGLLDPDDVGIATLNASMPAQKFRLLTLRQSIELVLGTALATGTYRVNASKKLDTWDSDPGLDAAPFDVVWGTPGAGELAPETLTLKADTSNLYNAYWVRGATAAGSGWFTDAASIAQWGRREKYIDAPDSDLAWKAFNVGMAALADTAQPLYRGTFTTRAPYDGWRSNQRFALTSAAHGFTAEPFDTVRITRGYETGEAAQTYSIEFGSPQGSFAARTGKEARRGSTGPGAGGGGGGGSGTGYIPGGGSVPCCGSTVISGLCAGSLLWSNGGVTGDGTLTGDGIAGNTSVVAESGASGGSVTAGLTGSPWALDEASWSVAMNVTLSPNNIAWTGAHVFAVFAGDMEVLVSNTGVGVTGVHGSSGAGTALCQIIIGAHDFSDPVLEFEIAYVTDYTIVFEYGPSSAASVTINGRSASGTAIIVPSSFGTYFENTDMDATGTFEVEVATVCTIASNQASIETAGTGDGSTTAFATAFPYQPGTLQVYVNDMPELGITETDPSTGSFTFDDPPFNSETVKVRYLEAGG